jgi:general secretion pathway protein K
MTATTAMTSRQGLGTRQRGTALLLAMVILTLIASLAAAMISQQQRAIAVEAAERARAQSAWVLVGALDWARLLLREDARSGKVDSLGEPWAVPLAEARLSTFLAADRDAPSEDEGPEAFLSGRVLDLQARYNLFNLVSEDPKLVEDELLVLRRLCAILGVSETMALRISEGMNAAAQDPAAGIAESAPLLPARMTQLSWLGVDPVTIERLEPYLTLLPTATPVNVNTAGREVLAAAIPGLDLGSAERLIQRRQRAPFRSLQAVQAELPPGMPEPPANRLGVGSSFFEVIGRLRLDERVFEERSVVERSVGNRGNQIVAIQRERRTLPPGALP